MASLMDHAWSVEAQRARRRIGALLLGGVALISALLFLAFLPLREKTRELAAELQTIEDAIVATQSAPPRRHPEARRQGKRFHAESILPVISQDEWGNRLETNRVRQTSLAEEWRTLREKIGTFGGEAALNQWLDAPEEGRIDFKVSLFNVRVRMAEDAKRVGMKFPADLGVSETIGADESAEVRLWQLATSVRFLEICMAVKIPTVEAIEALPPFQRPQVPGDSTLQIVYPLQVRFRCSYDRFQELIRQLNQPGAYFGLSNILLTKNRPGEQEPVDVSVMLHATVFREPPRPLDPPGAVGDTKDRSP